MTGKSWHEGCPVPIGALRVVSLDYYDFDGAVAQGKLVVNRKVASEIVSVFERLFAARFPIMHMEATDLYPPGELTAPVHDDTVSFNCRPIAGTTMWSQHAYGLAVDINPVENPSVEGERVVPRAGSTYVDRAQKLPGMVHANDAVVRAFAGIGWGWGGDWHSKKDYMHFSATGG